MIDPQWKRIAGIHVQEDGDIGAVWLAHDKLDDSIKIYDACLFTREVPVVIAEGLNARGRWIPIAWRQKDKEVADKLLERGCKMLWEGYKDDDSMAQIISRDIWERMRTHRFTVDKRLKNWLEEAEAFDFDNNKIPTSTFPLMSATRHAMARLEYAKRQITKRKEVNYPKVAII